MQENAYYEFTKRFGTHYLRGAEFGARIVSETWLRRDLSDSCSSGEQAWDVLFGCFSADNPTYLRSSKRNAEIVGKGA